MQLIVEIPDTIIARSLNDSLKLSLDINCKGEVKSVNTQEYGYRELTYTTMNDLCRFDILRLKHKLEEQDNKIYGE